MKTSEKLSRVSDQAQLVPKSYCKSLAQRGQGDPYTVRRSALACPLDCRSRTRQLQMKVSVSCTSCPSRIKMHLSHTSHTFLFSYLCFYFLFRVLFEQLRIETATRQVTISARFDHLNMHRSTAHRCSMRLVACKPPAPGQPASSPGADV